MKSIVFFIATTIFSTNIFSASIDGALSKNNDSSQEIKESIITQSIQQYPGVCACPYSVMRNGRACGRRSAYSKPGGYSPKCYPQDVSDEEVARYMKAK